MSEKLYILTINVDNIDKGTFITVPELQAALNEWECDRKWDFHAMQRGIELYIQARREAVGDHNEEPPFDFDWSMRNIFNYRVVVGHRAYRCPTDPYVPNCILGTMIAHAEFQADVDFMHGYSRAGVWVEGDYIYLGHEVYAYAMTEEHRK